MTTNDSNLWTYERITRWLFALALIALYFFALDVPLLGPDEPRYSQVAREMFERGDFVTTTLGGYHWFEKPALLYWIQMVFYSVFGVTEFAARTGSALFGLGTAGSLFLLGKRITKDSDGFDYGFWFGLVCATSLGLMVFARGASFDIMITFPVTAAMVSFYLWRLESKTIWLALFYVFMGVGLLAKGLIGFVFPSAIVTFYLLLTRQWPRKSEFVSLLWGLPITLLVASAWYYPVIAKHGQEFIDEFFIGHHFQRFTSNKYTHPGPFYYFWLILPAMTIPWIPFFLAGAYRRVKGLFQRKDFGNGVENDLEVYAFAWMLVLLVFFSFSGSKLPGYILPALPAAIIVSVFAIKRFSSKKTWAPQALKWLAAVTVLVIASILAFILPNFAKQDSVKHMVDTAKAAGYSDTKILNVHGISHNAEFYAPGRLVRDKDTGKQWQFYGDAEVAEYMEDNKLDAVLILIPHQFENQFLDSKHVKSKVLERDAEFAIMSVERK